MNKQLGKKILLVLAAVMVMILLSSFKMQNEGDRSFKKIVLNKNKSVEYTVDVGKMGLLKYWLEPNVFSVALRCQTEDDTLKLRCETEGVDAIISQGSKKGIWKKLKSEDNDLKEKKQKKEKKSKNVYYTVHLNDIYNSYDDKTVSEDDMIEAIKKETTL